MIGRLHEEQIGSCICFSVDIVKNKFIQNIRNIVFDQHNLTGIIEASEETRVMNQETVNAFLDSLRSDQTRQTYEQALHRVCDDPVVFLELMRSDKKAAEARILAFISENRNKLSGSTIRTWLAGIRSLHDFAEIQPPLNWKKLIKSAPRAGKSQDRPVNLDEVRKIFNIADVRGKFIISLLRSGGFRVGAFDYFLLRDLKPFEVLDSNKDKLNPVKVEIGRLQVHSGEAEAYS
jgi:hypothetical protein